jgi:DNA polymerase III delta subunit
VDRDPDNARLTLKWSLKNVSKEDIRLIESNVLRDYRILVADQYGKPVPLTQEGERAFQVSFFSSRRLVVLRPGEELKREINLASLYDLKPRNIYIINLERQIATPNAREQVRAGPLRVTLR